MTIEETYNNVHSILTAPDVVDRLESERSNPLFGFIDQYMAGCEHVNYHHEGDVWVHTKMVIDNILKDKHDYLDVAAALLHDIGKKDALAKNNGKNMAGHEKLGLPLAEAVLDSFGFKQHEKDVVLWIVENHTQANALPKAKQKFACWTFVSHPWINRVFKLAVADSNSTIDADGNPAMDYMEEINANPIVVYCMSHPMPSHLVTWNDMISYPGVEQITDANKKFELFELCHKIQINGGGNKKDSILRAALRCMKDKGSL